MAIFICNKPGQLGNRLILYSNLLCFGKEYGIKIFNPSFDEYSKYFEGTKTTPKLWRKFYFTFFNILARLSNRLKLRSKLIYSLQTDWYELFTLDNSPKSQPLFSKICLLQGWFYRNNTLIQKHKSLLLDVFKPKKEFQTLIDDYIKENFEHNAIIVGLHLRRGDYRTFEGGKYYYSLENYLSIIEKLNTEFQHKVKFMIASNDNETLKYFKNFNLPIVFAPNHELLDMYCLAMCDYIVGPPSTYTMWASFYGNKPLLMIKEVNQKITLESFQVVNSF